MKQGEKEWRREKESKRSCGREGERKVTVQTSQLSLPLRLLYADSFFPWISEKIRPRTAWVHGKSRSTGEYLNEILGHDRKYERSTESRIETMTDQLIPLFRSLTHAKRSPAIFNRYYSSVNDSSVSSKNRILLAGIFPRSFVSENIKNLPREFSEWQRNRWERSRLIKRTFVVNTKIVLGEANVIVLVLGTPRAWQRRFFFVYHRIEHL